MSSKSKKSKKESADSGDEAQSNQIKLSNSRYLTVSEFKNRMRVDIREFYLNEDGERKPGKKGISLSLDEWKKIVDNLDKIQKMLKEVPSSSDTDSE